jgi:ATP-dependent Clp protease ATP-binding subunit ClpC
MQARRTEAGEDVTKLSFCGKMAVQVAVVETGITRYEYLEKEHLLIGIFSLEKVEISIRDDPEHMKARYLIQRERDVIDYLLRGSRDDVTVLRRLLRGRLGDGGYTRQGGEVCHRSSDCREYFSRASQLADYQRVSCLHFLAAIAEKPGLIIGDQFREAGINPDALFKEIMEVLAKGRPQG